MIRVSLIWYLISNLCSFAVFSLIKLPRISICWWKSSVRQVDGLLVKNLNQLCSNFLKSFHSIVLKNNLLCIPSPSMFALNPNSFYILEILSLLVGDKRRVHLIWIIFPLCCWYCTLVDAGRAIQFWRSDIIDHCKEVNINRTTTTTS